MQNESEPNAAGQADDSLSDEELISLMTDEPEAEEGEVEEAEESEETEEEEEESPEPEETEEEDEPEAEAGEIDFNQLTDEQWEIVRTKLKSRAAADIQKQKREIQQLRDEVARIQNQQPAAAQPDEVESPYLKGIETADQLKAKVTDLKQLARTVESLLDDHEDYGPDDPIEYGGKTYTKKALKKVRFDVREALDEAVPYKAHQIQQRAHFTELEQKLNAAVRQEIPELEDEETTIGKNFKAITNDPAMKKVRELVPEIAPVLERLIGHACRSLHGGVKSKPKEAPTTTGIKPKAKPPSSPSGVAAPAPKGGDQQKVKAKEAKEKRYYDSGDPEDLIAAMAES